MVAFTDMFSFKDFITTELSFQVFKLLFMIRIVGLLFLHESSELSLCFLYSFSYHIKKKSFGQNTFTQL